MVSVRLTKSLSVLALLLGAVTTQAYASSVGAPPDGYVLVEDEPAVTPANTTFKALASDKTFRNTLSRWAKETGWKLSWELPDEYSFSYAANFGTDFIKAVDGLCANLNSTGVRARAIAYQENKVVRIVLEGAQR